ncbi:hypothetical protein [Paraflavitalea pollutisoli]|uniref:hypothetical protein n=1 Tax=Paraflavitalea pollutisoli TaxID=3034143 RepID=UPI0023EBF830|nr:hypothetical protein [Paraflavitalea sp. H1-2-19X]
MVQTGTGIPLMLSLLAILLPLIPIVIIFVRRTWQLDTMIFLGVICLFSCLQHLLIYMPQSQPGNTAIINSLFGLAELGLLLYLYRLIIRAKWATELLHTVLIAFASVAITMYALGGMMKYAAPLAMTAAFILLLVSVVALVQLIRHKQLYIFQSPMFWIAAGNICFFSMYLLTGVLLVRGTSTPSLQQEKTILLSVLHVIRFAFFIIAAATVWPPKQTDGSVKNHPWQ